MFVCRYFGKFFSIWGRWGGLVRFFLEFIFIFRFRGGFGMSMGGLVWKGGIWVFILFLFFLVVYFWG